MKRAIILEEFFLKANLYMNKSELLLYKKKLGFNSNGW